jgi:hypothetical protein
MLVLVPEDVQKSIMIIAILTPVLGLILYGVSTLTSRASGQSVPAPIRRSAIILLFMGPLNLVLWFLMNQWLERIGYRSVIGYVLAALVFIVGGYLGRRWRRKKA